MTMRLSWPKPVSIITFFICALFVNTSSAAIWNITYPRPLSTEDKRNFYPIEVLKLALEKTGVKYQLSPSDRILLPAKASRQLKESRGINVLWSMTDKQKESDFLPIRIPIAKGLIGWRVMLIHTDEQARFSSLNNLADLQAMAPVQVVDWADTKILQANGFNVITTSTYSDAFVSATERESDFFPRSVMEVVNELASLGKGANLVLDAHSVIQYPAAMYFFVNRSNTTLANLIETGLKMAIKSGEFDILFADSFAQTFADIGLSKRQVFRLDNPFLPNETPLADQSLWYQGPAQAPD